MTIELVLYQAMTSWLRGKVLSDVVAVSGYKEFTTRSGYCDTCTDSSTDVIIWWLDRRGAPHWWRYLGDFTELIRELTRDIGDADALLNAVRREDEEARWDAPHQDEVWGSGSPYSGVGI